MLILINVICIPINRKVVFYMNVDVIGVPIDLGANRRGVDMGASAIRYANLKETILNLNMGYNDLGNIDVHAPKSYDEFTDPSLKNLEEINFTNKKLSESVCKSINQGNFPLILGGDHSIGIGAIMGVQEALSNIGLIWIDAHGDFNNGDISLSGNIHGMSLAAVTGYANDKLTNFKSENTPYINPKNVALIGIRDIDKAEGKLLKESGVNIFTMSDIDACGMKEIMNKALQIVTNGTKGFHLSFDMDSISPLEAPGVGTPVNGGLTYREAHLAAEMIAKDGNLISMDLSEVNPILDHMNQTAKLAVTLISSALGKNII